MIDEVSSKNALIGDRLLLGLIMSGPSRVSWIGLISDLREN